LWLCSHDLSVIFRAVAHEDKWAQLYEGSEAVLPRPFTLSSEVMHGFKRGSTELGFPTANLNLESLTISPLGWGEEEASADVECKDSLRLENMKTGVYVGCARIHHSAADDDDDASLTSPSTHRYYPCVFSVGWNPTYNNTSQTIEAHLLDIDINSTLPHEDPLPSDFYGEVIDIHSLVYLREEQKFDNLGYCEREPADFLLHFAPCSINH
jgi:riboflavin kinase